MAVEISIVEEDPAAKLSVENRILKLQRDQLRRALVGLIGCDSEADLEAMEAFIRMAPVPDVDKMNTINAIQALLRTEA